MTFGCSRRQVLAATLGVAVGTGGVVRGGSGSDGGESAEGSVVVDFESGLDASGTMANDQNWAQTAGPCCSDGKTANRFYTWAEQEEGDPSKDLPTNTREATDYTKSYRERIGGNFMIQQSGGYGNFYSTFSFSEYSDTYPGAPYKPSALRVRVGGNDREAGFNDRGYVALRDETENTVIRFQFENDDGAGPFLLNGMEVESDRNNGLYEVVLDRIDWGGGTFDVSVFRQTQSGYESSPVFERSAVAFKEGTATNLDSVKMHMTEAGHVYMDALAFEPGSDGGAASGTPSVTGDGKDTLTTTSTATNGGATRTQGTAVSSAGTGTSTAGLPGDNRQTTEDGGGIPIDLLGTGLVGAVLLGGGAYTVKKNRITGAGSDGTSSVQAGATKPPTARRDESTETIENLLASAETKEREGRAAIDDGDYRTGVESLESALTTYEITLKQGTGSADAAMEGVRSTVEELRAELETLREQRQAVASVDRAVERGNELVDRASERLADRAYEDAIDAYDKALDVLQEAESSAEEHGLDGHGSELAALRDDAEAGLDRAVSEQDTYYDVEEALDRVRADLDTADRLQGLGWYDEAAGRYESVAGELEALEETVAEFGFESLQREIDELRTTCEQDRRSAQSAFVGPPSTIPEPPVLNLTYDDLDEGDLIGRGGNADVYRCSVSVAGETSEVAVKEPRFEGTVDTGTAEAFIREAETWEQLDEHEHVVGVVDWGTKPLPWIAMEYMDGGHLGTRAGDLPLGQAVWTALSVVTGVRHAHNSGVVHLDITPSNILMQSVEDVWDVPKVADWGLAKMLLHHSQSIEGFSPQYAAPEQLDEEHGTTDRLTDIYSLGAVFYELFTGQPPFEGGTARVVTKVLNEEPTPPTEVNPELPDALGDIIETAMAKDRSDRYEDLIYLRDDLRDLPDAI